MNLNRRVPIWLACCIVAVILGCVWLSARRLITPRNDFSAPEPTLSARTLPLPSSEKIRGSILPSSSASAVASADPVEANQTPGDWKTYRNTRYAFEFRYPAMWGNVEFGEASSKGGVLEDVQGLRRPDTGGIFVGTFSGNPSCGFGAITPDYSYPGEMPLFVSAGWKEISGHYYSLWPDKSVAIPNLKYDTELLPTRFEMMASNAAKALVFENADAALEDNLLTADINLPGPLFGGITFGCALGYRDTATTISTDRQGFEIMLKSFRYE